MKNTDLYKGFGEIDDELIDRAQPDEVNQIRGDAERKEVKVKKFNWVKLGKIAGGVIAACLVVAVGFGTLGGFFRAGKAASRDSLSGGQYKYAETEAAVADMAWNGAAMPTEAPAAAAPVAMEEAGYGGYGGKGSDGGSSLAIQNSGIRNKNVKLVYTAYMEVQTLDYAEAEAQIYALVDKFGGYLESTYRYNGGYYSDEFNEDGSYTVRIPAEHYADFVNGLGETCHVVNINQSVEDITLSYSDVEKRLATLETKYDRLLELLSKATEMTDIIDLESAIAECEYEIDSYTSTKNRYDSLVNYSTITIQLTEVSRLAEPVQVDNSFFARLGRTFKNGLNNALDSLDRFVMWFSFNFVGIIIFIVIVILAARWIKKYPFKRRKKNDINEQ